MLSRRALLPALGLLPVGLDPRNLIGGAGGLFAGLEARSGGRLGVAALDLKTGRRLAFRDAERFPLCSTFKFLAAAAVLRRIDLGQARLSDAIPYGKGDLVDYSPITSMHVDEGFMTLADLCEAAMTHSDNTAGNLILSTIGGPAGVTEFARTLGDRLTRLDRTETSLNEAAAGDPRDTTTPAAMLADMQALLLGKILSRPSAMRLTGWMAANTTGGNRLRAGMPQGWKVGDKTGSGANGTANDIAIVWPDAHGPFLLAVYLTGSSLDAPSRDQIIAQTGRAVAHLLRGVPNHG